MITKLVLREAAVEMARDAYTWYEQKLQGLGIRFLDALEQALQNIESHPTHYGYIKENYRQVKLNKFPYVVVYEIIESTIVVFAVLHQSRNTQLKQTK